MIVELFDIADAARLALALGVRMRVFVEEQGVPAEEEIDAHDRTDATAVHALVRDGGRAVVGAGRYFAADHRSVQIGRMAVLASARRSGAGRTLLRALVAEATRRGFSRAHLHAQVHAREFYLKAGFFDDGEPLLDAGILHQPMSLELA